MSISEIKTLDHLTLTAIVFLMNFWCVSEALLSNHPLMFYHVVPYESSLHKQPGLVVTTFSNFRGGCLKELWLYNNKLKVKNIVQAPVVNMLDSAIYWINHYPVDKH